MFWPWVYVEHGGRFERDGKIILSWRDELQSFVAEEERVEKKDNDYKELKVNEITNYTKL